MLLQARCYRTYYRYQYNIRSRNKLKEDFSHRVDTARRHRKRALSVFRTSASRPPLLLEKHRRQAGRGICAADEGEHAVVGEPHPGRRALEAQDGGLPPGGLGVVELAG